MTRVCKCMCICVYLCAHVCGCAQRVCVPWDEWTFGTLPPLPNSFPRSTHTKTATQAQEDAAFLRKVDGMLAHSARQRDEAFDAYADDDDEASFGGVNLGASTGLFSSVCTSRSFGGD